MIKTLTKLFFLALPTLAVAQNPSAFPCTSSDGFGYYISSASSTSSGSGSSTTLTYSSSRLSRITTSTGVRTTVCTDAQVGVALNALGFNPKDTFLYAVSRYDATQFSGKLYRLGANCQKLVIPVTGAIAQFSNNNRATIDAAGGNISSGTFDLDNNYYVNTSFTNTSSTGFRNKLQKIKITGNTATLVSSQNLTCPSCTTSTKVQITDIIFDAPTQKLYGNNRQTNQLYSINATTGVITPIGTTGITSSILGLYKNAFGDVRAIDETGRIYSVNVSTGAFTLLNTVTLNSGNADAASGCYDPPSISGNLFTDANGLTDNIVNGEGVNQIGTTVLYANLIQSGLVVKSTLIRANGSFNFLSESFLGAYEVQISSIAGITGEAPPAQNLPATHVFVGDNLGIGAGNDGSPNGRLTINVAAGGGSIENVNFGIDAKPIASDVTDSPQANPGGSTRVAVPALVVADQEDGVPTTIIINEIPNAVTEGVLYYNNIAVTNNQVIPNFLASLLTFDPIDGDLTIDFLYSTRDAANVPSNTATMTMEFSTTFPVELIAFGGVYRRNVVEMVWITATETNSDYFLVQRSQDGTTFEDIGKLQAAGNSVKQSNYNFTDKMPQGYFYYRLKQVDTDGTISFSDAIYVAHKDDLAIKIFPTLVSDKLTIQYNPNEVKELHVEIFNSKGEKVLATQLYSGNQELDLQNLAAGSYTLMLSDLATGTVIPRKIIKN